MAFSGNATDPTPADIERVSGRADVGGMLRIRDIAARDGVAPDAIWARVRSGELAAYRAPWGRDQWEWRLTEHGLPDAVSSGSTLLLLPPERVA